MPPALLLPPHSSQDRDPSSQGWNTDGIKCGAIGVDDFAFFEALLAFAERELCVDLSRVYAIGFSTGAFLYTGPPDSATFYEPSPPPPAGGGGATPPPPAAQRARFDSGYPEAMLLLIYCCCCCTWYAGLTMLVSKSIEPITA